MKIIRGSFVCCSVALLLMLSPSRVSASTVEEEVRTYFEDIPVMIAIARCESGFRQFTDDGVPFTGGWGGDMVGVFQIFAGVHAQAATALGLDLETLEGNLAYARHLYAASGTAPWNSARACWENAVETGEPDTAELIERIKTLQALVVQLQQLLALQKTAGQIAS